MQIPRVFLPLLKLRTRYKVMYGGRGSGKSHTVARVLLIMGMQRKMRIVCAREVQTSITDSVHRLLSDLIQEYGLSSFYTVQNDKIIGSNGTLILFKGLKHNVSGIKSLEGCDICWVEEAENVTDHSWETVIPTIRKEYKDAETNELVSSEIWVTFNTRYTSDPTYRRYVRNGDPDIWCVKVSWRENPFFPEVLDKERRRLEQADPEAYAHVWEGEPDTRRTGFIYAKQIHAAREAGRITLVPYDPGHAVFTGWDLGFGDSTDIFWAQHVGRELRVIDYYSNVGEQLDHYAKVLREKPYSYAPTAAWLPHDGSHGNIRGLSVSQQLRDLGISNIVLDRESDVAPGIELVRQMLGFMVFDEVKTKEGIYALEHYRYQWDDLRQVFRSKPLHDWASNGADAMRTLVRAAARIRSFSAASRPNDPYRSDTSGSSWMGG